MTEPKTYAMIEDEYNDKWDHKTELWEASKQDSPDRYESAKNVFFWIIFLGTIVFFILS